MTSTYEKTEYKLPCKMRWKEKHRSGTPRFEMNKPKKYLFSGNEILWFTQQQLKALKDMEKAIKIQ